MGGRKKKVVYPPGYRKLEQFFNVVTSTSPVDISAFQQAISKAIGSKIAEVTKNIEGVKEKRLRGLQHALSAAIGTVQYNPYAERITSALERIRQTSVEPLKQTEQSIISEYQRISPDIAKSLMLAGGYQAVPTLRGKIEEIRKTASDKPWSLWDYSIESQLKDPEEFAKLLEQQTSQSYQAVMKFFDETKQMLQNLGLSEEEINSALSPYLDLMKKGTATALSIGFPEYESLKAQLEERKEQSETDQYYY